MAGHDIVVIGASAGGVEALSILVSLLPADFPATVFVVLHIPAHSPSLLPQILDRKGPMPASHAVDGESIRPGRIFIAPPDFHLLLERGRIRLIKGPRENGHRPAIDPLFRSAALAYGSSVVGVILSGTLDDGSSGLQAIQERGGRTIVQDPEEALHAGMPRNAIEAVAVDHVLPVAGIAAELDRLARDVIQDSEGRPIPDDMDQENQMSAFDLDAIEDEDHPGRPSGFACPDCGGTLWERTDGELIQFRCRVGHAWTANGLVAEQTEGIETALWTALRALEERAALCNRVASRMEERGRTTSATRFREQAAESKQRAALLRRVLVTAPSRSVERGPETMPGPENDSTRPGQGVQDG